MTASLNKLENGTIELTITVPWSDVDKTYQEIKKKLKAEIELPGFRKGKAPDELAEKSLDKTKIFEEAIKEMLPSLYSEAIASHHIHPVISPKIELVEAKEEKDWIIKAYTCEKPNLELGNYKEAIKEVKAQKHKKLWVPGQEQKKEEKEEDKKPTIDELLKALFTAVTVKLPDLLVEHEVNRLLSDLIDQTKKLGLTVDQYLTSTGRNGDSIRKEYQDQAKKTLTLEFALEKIADTEGILISDDDIDTVIKAAKSDEEKKALEHERYYLASVLRRQKTLDFLSSV